MATELLAVCGFHVCCVADVQDGLTTGQRISDKHINKYKYLNTNRHSIRIVSWLPVEIKVMVGKKSLLQRLKLRMCILFPTPITIPTYHSTFFHPHINCVDEKNKKIL